VISINVIELRDKLNILIEVGKSKQTVFYNDGCSGLEEIINVKEDYNSYDGEHIQLV
jgi:hypothetical protein